MVNVFILLIIQVGNDILVCQGDLFVLSEFLFELGVMYNWAGLESIEDFVDFNMVIFL